MDYESGFYTKQIHLVDNLFIGEYELNCYTIADIIEIDFFVNFQFRDRNNLRLKHPINRLFRFPRARIFFKQIDPPFLIRASCNHTQTKLFIRLACNRSCVTSVSLAAWKTRRYTKEARLKKARRYYENMETTRRPV